VTSFVLSTDESRPRPQQVFHAIISLRVAQTVGNLDEVVLPSFGPLEILGDEKRLTPVRAGTAYQETITLLARQSGAITITPAYIDAIDTRDNQKKQFLTNPLVIDVQGQPLAAPHVHTGIARYGLLLLALAGVSLLGLSVLLGLIAVMVSRARAAPAPAATYQSPPAELPALDDRDRALQLLRAHPTREAAIEARATIRSAVGATPYETLSDVLRRPGAQAPPVRFALQALERAAFTHDGDLPTAIAAAIIALERYYG
jgi:hypothetical protein